MNATTSIGAVVRDTLTRGDVTDAMQRCRTYIRQSPEDAEGHRHLAQLLAASGEVRTAYASAQRACELAPDDARCWSDLGRVYAIERHFADAARCFTEAVKIDPVYADGWHNLGTALKKLGEREAAFDALKRALLLDPTRAETYLNLGNLLIEADQLDDAVECFERAARHDPRLAAARSRLAQQLSTRGKVKRAATLFRQSVGLDPDHVHGWFGLGRTLEDLGEAEGALGCYLNVIARCPEHAAAVGQYLALVREEANPEVLHLAESKLKDSGVKDEARALLGYGLLKFYDRRKNHAAAAQAGIAANAARRAAAGPLDRNALTARIDGIIAACTREFFHERRRFGVGVDQPVFIVGLPRSGTTLTEQVIASHPLLHGAGELPDLAQVAIRCVGDDEHPWRAAMHLELMSSRARAHEYLRALRGGAPHGCLRISDKSPLNFFHLGLVALLFPHARIIHCRREPRDNALSIWMENFNPGQHYATDVGDLAFFTREYERLMAHWREHLPLRMLEVQYEETVADLQTQARRILEFLGAPWDPRCLEFHSSQRAVQTPSRWQVRQPIYTSSVARWRNYLPWLPELESAFASVSTSSNHSQ